MIVINVVVMNVKYNIQKKITRPLNLVSTEGLKEKLQ